VANASFGFVSPSCGLDVPEPDFMHGFWFVCHMELAESRVPLLPTENRARPGKVKPLISGCFLAVRGLQELEIQIETPGFPGYRLTP
jgi:hypothetical protein